MVAMIALIWALATLKWGRWKEWKTYYPTILFFIAGDFIHSYIAAAKPLWRYGPDPLFSAVSEHLITSLVIFPCTVLLFFSFYPQFKSLTIKTLYVVVWVLIYSTGEYLANILGYFVYQNSWSLVYSALFDCLLFPLLIIHQKKPQIAWLSSLIIGSFIIFWFKLPASH